MDKTAQLLEILMVVSFGLSWPNNIITTLRNKSAKGKSIAFLLLIDTGYVFGIVSKIISHNIVFYVMLFYILNFLMVTADIVLYFYFRHRERKREKA